MGGRRSAETKFKVNVQTAGRKELGGVLKALQDIHSALGDIRKDFSAAFQGGASAALQASRQIQQVEKATEKAAVAQNTLNTAYAKGAQLSLFGGRASGAGGGQIPLSMNRGTAQGIVGRIDPARFAARTADLRGAGSSAGAARIAHEANELEGRLRRSKDEAAASAAMGGSGGGGGGGGGGRGRLRLEEQLHGIDQTENEDRARLQARHTRRRHREMVQARSQLADFGERGIPIPSQDETRLGVGRPITARRVAMLKKNYMGRLDEPSLPPGAQGFLAQDLAGEARIAESELPRHAHQMAMFEEGIGAFPGRAGAGRQARAKMGMNPLWMRGLGRAIGVHMPRMIPAANAARLAEMGTRFGPYAAIAAGGFMAGGDMVGGAADVLSSGAGGAGSLARGMSSGAGYGIGTALGGVGGALAGGFFGGAISAKLGGMIGAPLGPMGAGGGALAGMALGGITGLLVGRLVGKTIGPMVDRTVQLGARGLDIRRQIQAYGGLAGGNGPAGGMVAAGLYGHKGLGSVQGVQEDSFLAQAASLGMSPEEAYATAMPAIRTAQANPYTQAAERTRMLSIHAARFGISSETSGLFGQNEVYGGRPLGQANALQGYDRTHAAALAIGLRGAGIGEFADQTAGLVNRYRRTGFSTPLGSIDTFNPMGGTGFLGNVGRLRGLGMAPEQAGQSAFGMNESLGNLAVNMPSSMLDVLGLQTFGGLGPVGRGIGPQQLLEARQRLTEGGVSSGLEGYLQGVGRAARGSPGAGGNLAFDALQKLGIKANPMKAQQMLNLAMNGQSMPFELGDRAASDTYGGVLKDSLMSQDPETARQGAIQKQQAVTGVKMAGAYNSFEAAAAEMSSAVSNFAKSLQGWADQLNQDAKFMSAVSTD